MCGGFFGGGGDVPDVTPAPVAPATSDPSVEEAAAKERALARKRKSRRSTILTGAMGLDETSNKTTMLGG